MVIGMASGVSPQTRADVSSGRAIGMRLLRLSGCGSVGGEGKRLVPAASLVPAAASAIEMGASAGKE